ncbi:ABD1 [Candida pseudojiufengensis]|uniref:ABD1 n=1 Tax=Candida pseudojiufengensis TaxID=497109 RepID=UPI00222440B8|nr:ABD1 [Candida pseudojiufengensis]KAI5960933.1 ABD1 [Candida pseudojiufengensis]
MSDTTDTYVPKSQRDSSDGTKFKVDRNRERLEISRREYATGVKTTSTYSKVETPGWMKKEPLKDLKYEKYGARSEASNLASTISLSSNQGKEKEQDSRLSRLKRSRQEMEKRYDYDEKREDEDEEENTSIQPYLRLDVANPSTIQSGKDNYHTFQSKIHDKENRDINSIVRQHYNQRTQQSKRQGSRVNSPIYKLRNFNNTIKYILLSNWGKCVKDESTKSPLFAVLDLCCGKGGDLNKCEFIKIDQYIGIDISDVSVREAYDRYSKQKARFKTHHRSENKYNFEACFATGDCFTQFVPEMLEPNFPGIIEKTFPVDLVSIQFALHYAFENEQKVRTLLTNISRSLKTGGRFIGTIPSSDFFKAKITNKQFYRDQDGKTKFGNNLYSVTFDKPPPEDGVFRPPFGNRYIYWLKDAVDNVPEYVVPFETLRSLCEEFNLILKYKKNFVDIFNSEIPHFFNKLNKNLIDGLKRSDNKYGAEGDEKEAVGFYVGFVFEKI